MTEEQCLKAIRVMMKAVLTNIDAAQLWMPGYCWDMSIVVLLMALRLGVIIMPNTSLMSERTWAMRYENSEFDNPERSVQFKEIFDRYLPRNGTCFEIGCYPGRYLAYLGKRFGYTVSGIDSFRGSKETLTEWLSNYDVRVGSIVEGEFFHFVSESRYDVVCSFGFIEHFVDTEDVIRRHLRLLKPGGILILTAPNFRKVQYLLHRWLDDENLKEHNIDSMDLDKWSDILLANEMEILYQGYYGTAGFWAEDATERRFGFLLVRNFITSLLSYSMLLIDKIIHCPNSAMSPYMFSVSRKKMPESSEDSSLNSPSLRT